MQAAPLVCELAIWNVAAPPFEPGADAHPVRPGADAEALLHALGVVPGAPDSSSYSKSRADQDVQAKVAGGECSAVFASPVCSEEAAAPRSVAVQVNLSHSQIVQLQQQMEKHI